MNDSEKTMEEAKDVITPEQKTKIEEGIKEINEALEGEDIEDIKSKTETLHSAVYEVSAAMYQKAQENVKTDEAQSDRRSRIW